MPDLVPLYPWRAVLLLRLRALRVKGVRSLAEDAEERALTDAVWGGLPRFPRPWTPKATAQVSADYRWMNAPHRATEAYHA